MEREDKQNRKKNRLSRYYLTTEMLIPQLSFVLSLSLEALDIPQETYKQDIQTDRQIYTHTDTDIATYRLNWPRG